MTMELAGDRPPRYGNIKTRGLSYRGVHRDQEVSPTGRALIYETPSITCVTRDAHFEEIEALPVQRW